MKHIRLKKLILVLMAMVMLAAVSGCSYKADKYNDEGLGYYESGDYDSAVQCFDNAINSYGKKSEYYVNKSFALMAKEDYTGAADAINGALSLEPDSRYVLRAQGILYYKTGKYTEAIDSFKSCLDKVGNHVTDLEYDVLMYKADAELSAGLPADAVNTYSILIETKGNDSGFYFWRAKSYIALGDEDGALSDFEDYIACLGDYESYIQVYYELKNSGYEESAADILGRALKLSGNSSSDYKYRGIIYYILGDYNKAITEYQKIPEGDKNSEICIYEGIAFEALGDLDNASEFYTAAVEKGGGDAALFYEIAVCNMNLGHYDDAIYYINRGIETGDAEYQEKLMYLEIICYEYSHKYGSAAESVVSYIEKFGTSEELEHELAFLRSRTEN